MGILRPILSIPAQVFTESYFSFWVLVSMGWGFGAAITITILPIFESQDEIGNVFGGLFNYITGRKGDAQYAEEETPVKTVEDPAEAPAEDVAAAPTAESAGESGIQ